MAMFRATFVSPLHLPVRVSITIVIVVMVKSCPKQLCLKKGFF